MSLKVVIFDNGPVRDALAEKLNNGMEVTKKKRILVVDDNHALPSKPANEMIGASARTRMLPRSDILEADSRSARCKQRGGKTLPACQES